jgi:hypothetical protein
LGAIPSTADRLDKKNAGLHPSPLDVDIIALIGQKYGLCANNLDIVIDTALVPAGEQLSSASTKLELRDLQQHRT